MSCTTRGTYEVTSGSDLYLDMIHLSLLLCNIPAVDAKRRQLLKLCDTRQEDKISYIYYSVLACEMPTRKDYKARSAIEKKKETEADSLHFGCFL